TVLVTLLILRPSSHCLQSRKSSTPMTTATCGHESTLRIPSTISSIALVTSWSMRVGAVESTGTHRQHQHAEGGKSDCERSGQEQCDVVGAHQRHLHCSPARLSA